MKQDAKNPKPITTEELEKLEAVIIRSKMATKAARGTVVE